MSLSYQIREGRRWGCPNPATRYRTMTATGKWKWKRRKSRKLNKTSPTSTTRLMRIQMKIRKCWSNQMNNKNHNWCRVSRISQVNTIQISHQTREKAFLPSMSFPTHNNWIAQVIHITREPKIIRIIYSNRIARAHRKMWVCASLCDLPNIFPRARVSNCWWIAMRSGHRN